MNRIVSIEEVYNHVASIAKDCIPLGLVLDHDIRNFVLEQFKRLNRNKFNKEVLKYIEEVDLHKIVAVPKYQVPTALIKKYLISSRSENK
jgi:hypothetical protein